MSLTKTFGGPSLLSVGAALRFRLVTGASRQVNSSSAACLLPVTCTAAQLAEPQFDRLENGVPVGPLGG